MDDWHKGFAIHQTESDKEFYRQYDEWMNRTQEEVEEKRREERLQESFNELRAEWKEKHKHDEFIECNESMRKWDLLDWAKFFWTGKPTRRRKFKERNPDYVGPKPEV